MKDLEFVRMVASKVQFFGGRTFYVGGCVRDIMIEMYGTFKYYKNIKTCDEKCNVM